MPIYEYACPQCRTTFEEWLKSDDCDSVHPCPKCGADAERVISNTTFILKGGGWYVTEYGNKGADDHTGTPTPADGNAVVEKPADPAASSSSSTESSTDASAARKAGVGAPEKSKSPAQASGAGSPPPGAAALQSSASSADA